MKDTLQLGCTTGVLYGTDISIKDAILFLYENTVSVLEIGQDAPLLVHNDSEALPWDTIKLFKHVTLHAPAIKFGRNNETKKVFAGIRIIAERCNLQHVVIHPDVVEDGSIFDENIGFRIAFENMDYRKDTYTKPAEMYDLLTRFPTAGMVLDVNHVWTHDKTMNLAKEFYNLCGDRIIEIHLSGFKKLHDPLYKTKQIEIIKAIQDFSVPLIVESQMEKKDVSLEIQYIRDVISKI